MHLENIRIIFITIGLVGVLLFASPTIGLLVMPPASQEFTELYLLGPDHTFSSIPFNIKAGVDYSVYLGVVNHLGASCYYTSFAKLGNDTRLLPNPDLGDPSPLNALYESKSFISDGATWEAPLTFHVKKLAFFDGTSQLSDISINGIDFPVTQTSEWNSNKTGYYYNLFVELWIFNSTSEFYQYHNRFVSLVLNMTQ